MQLVGDRWRIETRATLGELWNDDPLTPEGAGLLAIGNVSYDGGADVTTSASTTSAAMVSGILRGGAWSGGFAELPGTGEESEGVGTEFERVFGNGATSTLLAGEDATKERLTELAPGARFIHVATHGWFAPESIPSWSDTRPLDEKSGLAARLSGEEQVKGMSPMLLCGLALAGANLPEDELGRAPGLVTADEIAALDLSGCELAVLSACDTNVGERRVGQGVASLQRALQMAGARTVITSLWKVPDEATKELMLDFYRRIWVDKKPKAHALWEAKKRLRDAKDERGQPLHTTRDWAAWVLTGDPR
jgi:CHAT domain-containing protein